MEPSITELLLSGVKLMLIGMTIVFLFLALLVWIIGVFAKLIHRYDLSSGFAEEGSILASDTGQELDDSEIVAAISAAIHRHENPL